MRLITCSNCYKPLLGVEGDGKMNLDDDTVLWLDCPCGKKNKVFVAHTLPPQEVQ